MAYALFLWALVLAALAGVYRRHLATCWREPVLRVPVLIFESDDWGAGPAEQAPALRRLAEILASVRDAAGRPAMMTLGVVLAIIDRDAWRTSGRYAARNLAASEHAEILAAMREGIAAGVLTPQLHGMEHYWPAALMRSAASDDRVRRWLADGEAATEALPDGLQSRWVDASQLPSQALAPAEIQQAVAEETHLFKVLFAVSPRVAVPNTFVWGDDVERAWAEQGVCYVITPGTRYEARGADGTLVPSGRMLVNGDSGLDGLRYLVRDVYFEPARDHQSGQLVQGLVERTRLGRPCLVETHRFNYLGSDAEHSFAALREALELAIREVPGVRLMSATALGDAIVARDPIMIEVGLLPRFVVWVNRVLTLSRFRKLAWASGLALLLHTGRAAAGLLSKPEAASL